MQQQHWLLEPFGSEVFTSFIQHENVARVQRISQTESVACIRAHVSQLFRNLTWRQPELVHAIVELRLFEEMHHGTAHQPFTLQCHPPCFRMFLALSAEESRNILVFSVLKENWILYNCQDMLANVLIFECHYLVFFKFSLKLILEVECEWH